MSRVWQISRACWHRTIRTCGHRALTTDAKVDDVVQRVSAGVVDGDRFMLSKAITFAESTRNDHRKIGARILDEALKARSALSAGHKTGSQTLRVGISGPPGVGKSTFIETLGMCLIRDYHARVAVIAIDPTSLRSRGAILGDKTRMSELSMMPDAFVRPCAAGAGHLGGLALHSDEVVLLCEAAGYDMVLIETVGVGQSETLVTEIADMCVLLLPPAGGDELQGIKRGIVETAHLVVVNKADGDMEMAAKRALSDYSAALQVMHSHGATAAAASQDNKVEVWHPKVVMASAATGLGVADICKMLFEFRDIQRQRGDLTRLRAEQRGAWMWRKAEDDLVKKLRAHVAVREQACCLTLALGRSEMSSRAAGRELVKTFVSALATPSQHP
mmetsp:Transcript_14049/g.22347  ORF Transcript_14049/g.22347 Transcript_14049/m.22347 type:complete len:388 (-) Transcript_14049:270-1433(-)